MTAAAIRWSTSMEMCNERVQRDVPLCACAAGAAGAGCAGGFQSDCHLGRSARDDRSTGCGRAGARAGDCRRVGATGRQWRDVLAARVASGLSAPVDRDAAEVDLRLAEVELTKARAASAARWSELKAAAGLDASAPLALAGRFEDIVAAIRRVPVA